MPGPRPDLALGTEPPVCGLRPGRCVRWPGVSGLARPEDFGRAARAAQAGEDVRPPHSAGYAKDTPASRVTCAPGRTRSPCLRTPDPLPANPVPSHIAGKFGPTGGQGIGSRLSSGPGHECQRSVPASARQPSFAGCSGDDRAESGASGSASADRAAYVSEGPPDFQEPEPCVDRHHRPPVAPPSQDQGTDAAPTLLRPPETTWVPYRPRHEGGPQPRTVRRILGVPTLHRTKRRGLCEELRPRSIDTGPGVGQG